MSVPTGPEAAAKTILGQNILGGMCARVCPTETLCEEACVREAAEGKPVEIGRLQRYATDTLMAAGTHPFERAAATGKKAETPAKQLKESIIAANELFKMSEYVLSDELSLVDCTLGPLLWRLPHYGVKLGKPGASVDSYAHRIFSRPSFKRSLTQAERDLILAA